MRSSHHRRNRRIQDLLFFSRCLLISLLIVVIASGGYFLYHSWQPETAAKQQTIAIGSTVSTESTATTASSSKTDPEEDSFVASNYQQLEKNGQDPSSTLAAKMDQQLDEAQFIGTALVVQNGHIILQKGYGLQNKETQQPNTATTLYQIGSIQKSCTATLILRLVDQGKLTLSDSLSLFYPEIPGSQTISIHEMLTMQSGLEMTDSLPDTFQAEDEVVAFALSHVKNTKNKKQTYQPVNYILLAGIIRQLTNSSYKEQFQQLIVEPLMLKHTFFYEDSMAQKDFAQNYKAVDGVDYAETYPVNYGNYVKELGTGNVAMSAGDLYYYFWSLMNHTLVSANSLQQLWTPLNGGTYIGGLYDFGGYYRCHGYKDDYRAMILMDKTGQNAVILLSNEGKPKKYPQLVVRLFQQLVPYSVKF